MDTATDAAAARFDAQPTGDRGTRLRRLSLEEIRLQADLERANRAAQAERAPER